MKAGTDVGMCTAALLADPFTASDDDLRGATEAAAGAGCSGLSVWSHQLAALGDPAQLAVPVAVVEGALLWSGPDAAAADTEARTLAAQAARHGAGLVLAVVLDADPPDAEQARAGLGRLAEQVAEAGARVCVEFLPWSGLPSLAAAWELVGPLSADVGIVLDAWHWQRQPGGPRPDILARIPGERIAYLQLCDAAAQPGPDPMAETMNGRLLPGDGVVDFAGLLAGLDAIGADPFVATEVFNPGIVRERGGTGAAGAMVGAARRVLAAALPA
jgi:sugar phosphate isomerase/epimerase